MLFLIESNLVGAVLFLLGILLGIVVHEAAHAWSAYRLGDDTALWQGRVTLNPAEHLDPLGSVMIVVAGFGWGKPTPVEVRNLRSPLWGSVAVAFAGPASNLLIVALCAGLIRLPLFQEGYPLLLTVYVALANGLLFVFNLIPIPPLDGAKVLYPLLPRSLDGFVQFMNQYGPAILILLILVSLLFESISPLGVILSLVRPLLNLFGLPTPL
ncbi:MAG: site-2 protease family protein [Rubrobacter sp.]